MGQFCMELIHMSECRTMCLKSSEICSGWLRLYGASFVLFLDKNVSCKPEWKLTECVIWTRMAFGWTCRLSQNGSGQTVSFEPEWNLPECVIWAGMAVGWMCDLNRNGSWLNVWFEPEWQLTMLGVSACCLCAYSLGPAHFFTWGIVSDPVAQFPWKWWLPVIFHLRWIGVT